MGGSAAEGSDNGPFGYVSFVEGSGALDMAERQAWRGFSPLSPLTPLSNVLNGTEDLAQISATVNYTPMSVGESVATRNAWCEEGESPVPPLIPSLMPIQRRSMRQTVDDVCADLISYVPSVGSSPHSNHGDLELGTQGGCIQRPVSISCCGHVLHTKCADLYFASLIRRQQQGQEFEGRSIVDLNAKEFLCPVCRRMANSLLPLVPVSTASPPSSSTSSSADGGDGGDNGDNGDNGDGGGGEGGKCTVIGDALAQLLGDGKRAVAAAKEGQRGEENGEENREEEEDEEGNKEDQESPCYYRPLPTCGGTRYKYVSLLLNSQLDATGMAHIRCRKSNVELCRKSSKGGGKKGARVKTKSGGGGGRMGIIAGEDIAKRVETFVDFLGTKADARQRNGTERGLNADGQRGLSHSLRVRHGDYSTFNEFAICNTSNNKYVPGKQG